MRPARGIRKIPQGFQAYVRVNGRFLSKSFPPDTALLIMRRWREEQRVRVRLGAELPKGAQTFEQDADDYLSSVQSMPSYSDQRRYILAWATVFAGRQRNAIQPLEIKAELERLRRRLTASSCNKRRTALMSFYTVLNGRSGYNPVRDVPKYAEDSERPRAQSLWTLYRILALMRPSKTRARLRVMLWTGLPQRQIKQLRPEHIDWKGQRVYVTPRRKGKGKAGGYLPLLPGAIVALRAFNEVRAFGSFSHSAMHARFRLALAKFNAHRARFDHAPLAIRPYDFRHSFGTMIAGIVTDERAIQTLMLHSRAEQSRRYTEAATQSRVEAAVQEVARQLQSR